MNTIFTMSVMVCNLMVTHPDIIDGCYRMQNYFEHVTMEACQEAIGGQVIDLRLRLNANGEWASTIGEVTCVASADAL